MQKRKGEILDTSPDWNDMLFDEADALYLASLLEASKSVCIRFDEDMESLMFCTRGNPSDADSMNASVTTY